MPQITAIKVDMLQMLAEEFDVIAQQQNENAN